MENLIKLPKEYPDFIDETALSEDKMYELESSIKDFFDNYKYNKYAQQESKIDSKLILQSASFLLLVILAIRKKFKEKYRLKYNTIYSQAKEVNDMYQKVIDLIKTNKAKRMLFQSSPIKIDTYGLRMKDNNNGKIYQLEIDDLDFSAYKFVKLIEKKIEEANKADIPKEQYIYSILSEINDIFNEDHGFVEYCEPILTMQTITTRLENGILHLKKEFEIQYGNIYVINSRISDQFASLKSIEVSYKILKNRYEKDEVLMKGVDAIFKRLIEIMNISMEFNDKALTIIMELYRKTYEELNKVYNMLKS